MKSSWGHGRSQSRPCFWTVFRKWSSAYLNAAMQIRMGTSANGHTDFGRPVSQNSYSQVKEKVTRRFKPLNALNVGCSAVTLTPPAWFFAALRVKSLTLQPWEDLWSQKCDIKIQYNLQAYYKASILWYLQAHWDQAPPVRPGRFLKNPGAHPGQVHPPSYDDVRCRWSPRDMLGSHITPGLQWPT